MATRGPRAPLTSYVLHRYDWSESSLILDLFTREQGRLAVAAKGAKKPYSNFRSVLLPFQRLNVSLSTAAARDESSNSDVQNLRGAEWAGGAAMLTGAALFSGFYLNELLMKLLARHDPHAALFDAYAETLPTLASDDEAQVQAALRAFELTLLQQTGVLPDLSLVTLTQQAVEPGARYALAPEAGVVVAREGELTGAALIGLQAALEHGSLPALRQACLQCLAALKLPLRAMVQHQLGATTALRTREVLRSLQSL
jgi:DNA repair protein RecO (recombination protein O)